jgi:hypothetical protein
MTLLIIGTVLAAMSTPLAAQWLNYPTPGIPRLADGKPNLLAPAPRAAGKPDLSGIWQLEPLPCSPSEVGTCGQDYTAGPEFLNMGVRIPGGLPYQPWVAELVKKRTVQTVGFRDGTWLDRAGSTISEAARMTEK